MTDSAIERRLQDIADLLADARHVVAQGRDRFLEASPDGRLLRSGAEMTIVKISSAIDKLPAAYRDAHPEIDWATIRKARNFLAHHYDKVNARLVWTTLCVDLPELEELLGLPERD